MHRATTGLLLTGTWDLCLVGLWLWTLDSSFDLTCGVMLFLENPRLMVPFAPPGPLPGDGRGFCISA